MERWIILIKNTLPSNVYSYTYFDQLKYTFVIGYEKLLKGKDDWLSFIISLLLFVFGFIVLSIIISVVHPIKYIINIINADIDGELDSYSQHPDKDKVD